MELEKIDSRPLLRANIPLLFNFLFSILIFYPHFCLFWRSGKESESRKPSRESNYTYGIYFLRIILCYFLFLFFLGIVISVMNPIVCILIKRTSTASIDIYTVGPN